MPRGALYDGMGCRESRAPDREHAHRGGTRVRRRAWLQDHTDDFTIGYGRNFQAEPRPSWCFSTPRTQRFARWTFYQRGGRISPPPGSTAAFGKMCGGRFWPVTWTTPAIIVGELAATRIILRRASGGIGVSDLENARDSTWKFTVALTRVSLQIPGQYDGI